MKVIYDKATQDSIDKLKVMIHDRVTALIDASLGTQPKSAMMTLDCRSEGERLHTLKRALQEDVLLEFYRNQMVNLGNMAVTTYIYEKGEIDIGDIPVKH